MGATPGRSRGGGRLASLLVLPLLLLGLLASFQPVLAQPSCPPLAIKAGASVRGQHAYVKFQLLRLYKTGGPASNVTVKVGMPASGMAIGKTKVVHGNKAIKTVVQENTVYFLNVQMDTRRKRSFLVKARLTGCSTSNVATTVLFQTLAYVLDANGQPYCPLAKDMHVRVKPSSKWARSDCPTASPTSAGAFQPFQVYGLGQRCLEAGRLAPWTRRAQEEEEGEGRELSHVVINTPYDCWTYCSINDFSVPTYFNWNTVTNQCFCCGGKCHLVYDPAYIAFVSDTPASLAPTPGPTTGPTLRPTSRPTAGPTNAPSQAPTFSPTAFNSTSSRVRRRLMAEAKVTAEPGATETKDPKKARRESDALFQREILSAALPRQEARGKAAAESVVDDRKVAIVTFLTEAPVEGYNHLQDYEAIYPLTSHSLKSYAAKHGYSFTLDRHPFDEAKQAYWRKMGLIREALDRKDVEWVLYTDLDVLVLDHARPLQDFMVPGRDIISVNEVNTLGGGEARVVETPRSGFLLLRNTERTRAFLDLWEDSFRFYADIENPEQSALETLFAAEAWANEVFLHDWSDFHSYDMSGLGVSAFSMHFPGKFKPSRVARMWTYMNSKGAAAYQNDELADYAATLLRGWVANLAKVAAELGYATHPADREEVDRCLATAAAAGYDVDTAYDADYHAYVDLYHDLGYMSDVPAAIFFTVPDKADLPSTVAANINSWRTLNPRHQIVVHDDADAERLVRRLVPELHGLWETLHKIQKADIYRFVVTAFLGGVYADSDTICAAPIADWGVRRDETLVVGVEAQNVDTAGMELHEGARTVLFSQYVFAGAAFHPGLLRMVRRLVGHKEQLLSAAAPALSPVERLRHVLATTGPVGFTDSLAEYMCYSFSHASRTPDNYWKGGEAPNMHIFGIAAFGAGQAHSASPSFTDPAVLVKHIFKGSLVLHGETWQQATA